MHITHPSHHRWHKHLSEDTLSNFGKNNRKRLRTVVDEIAQARTTITHEIVPLTDEIIDWFVPLYTENISKKSNPKIFNIRETTIAKDVPYTYYALILSEEGERIGATIFSERETFLSISYRVYPFNWNKHSLPANPSIYTEFAICEYAYKRGYRLLSHGKDRNPYGMNSGIGLCVFKLSVGCHPLLPEPDGFETVTLDTDSITVDTLVLQSPETGSNIKQASLFIVGDVEEKHLQVARYPDLLSVTTYLKKDNEWVATSL